MEKRWIGSGQEFGQVGGIIGVGCVAFKRGI
jgi:hypothetical protein